MHVCLVHLQTLMHIQSESDSGTTRAPEKGFELSPLFRSNIFSLLLTQSNPTAGFTNNTYLYAILLLISAKQN